MLRIPILQRRWRNYVAGKRFGFVLVAVTLRRELKNGVSHMNVCSWAIMYDTYSRGNNDLVPDWEEKIQYRLTREIFLDEEHDA